jgi:branched-chain amino acid transport system ATP-binding protein
MPLALIEDEPTVHAALSVRDLYAQYGEVLALKGVSLEVSAGSVVALLGANGAGKTSLLRAICGVLPPSRGAVLFDGQPITGWAPHRIVAGGIVQVPEGREVFPHLSVHDNLRMGGYRRRDRDAVARDIERCYALLPALRPRRRDPASALSGGQQQMLAVARAVVAQPRLLLLDEPSLGLSPLVVKEIWSIVRLMNREMGISVLLVEQNADAALGIADRGYVMENGRVRLDGSAEFLRCHPLVRDLYLGTRRQQAGRGP